MDIQEKLQGLIRSALESLGLPHAVITLEHPADLSHGDYATNVALVLAKEARSNPRELATRIVSVLSERAPQYLSRIEVAGPGFINFHLSRAFFSDSLSVIGKMGDRFGHSKILSGKKYLVEYTDPNPFKEFHIGHLMSNAIGESLARLCTAQGAKVKRMCYQGDIGPHVAKCLWAMRKNIANLPSRGASASEKAAFLGRSYAEGSTLYETDASAKAEIDEINKSIYEGAPRELARLYKLGRKWSLEKFEEIYRILGTRFDYYVLESEVVHDGVALVEKHKGTIFEESEGAVVFRAERDDPALHTRVFINSQGLPTYEAKELGLNMRKWNKIRPDRSIIITANEQRDYFRVLLAALDKIAPDVRAITEHISHGMMRFADGKMSSRKGNVITGESLIAETKKLVEARLSGRDIALKDQEGIAEIVAVAAIKYSILRQVSSSDIIYDFDKSISFEGDSGPYLLYSTVRARSVLAKAKREKVRPSVITVSDPVVPLERMLYRFPEVVSRAADERAPHHIATYLIEISSLFNAWYASTQIVLLHDNASPYRVQMTSAFAQVMENGLTLLGMRIPKEM